MNTTPTVTKKTKYLAMLDLIDAAETAGVAFSETVPADVMRSFVEAEVASLDKKAASAQKRAAEKKIEGDALRDRVESYLTDEPQTVATITAAIGDPDVSSQMVVSRLSQLIKAGRAVKEEVKVASTVDGGKARTLVAYHLA